MSSFKESTNQIWEDSLIRIKERLKFHASWSFQSLNFFPRDFTIQSSLGALTGISELSLLTFFALGHENP